MIMYTIECMLLGIVAAFTGIFYNYTLQNGAIFHKFGNLLNSWSDSGGFKEWISNILGVCIYCNTTWITIFILILYWNTEYNINDTPCMIIGGLAAISIQHIILRLYVLFHNKEE